MAATVVSSLAFATRVRVGRSPALAPRRRAMVVRAQSKPNDVAPTGKASTGLWTRWPSAARLPSASTAGSPWSASCPRSPTRHPRAGRGDGLFVQAASGTGQAWFAYMVAAQSVPSLVPLLQGETAEARSGGFMSANAKLWNGRLAMLRLVALAVTEYLTGARFINA